MCIILSSCTVTIRLDKFAIITDIGTDYWDKSLCQYRCKGETNNYIVKDTCNSFQIGDTIKLIDYNVTTISG